MDSDIKYIQNTLWAMYKTFMADHDMAEYNKQAKSLCDKYSDKPELLSFCQNLIITWAPMMRLLLEQWRESA